MVDLVHDLVHECLYILIRFGRRLKVLHTVLLGHLLRILKTYLALFCQVHFVTDEDLGNVLLGVLVDAIEPLTHILKGICIRQVEAQNDTLGLPIEVYSQRAEPVLASCVPDFDLHGGARRRVSWRVILSNVVEAERGHVVRRDFALAVHV